MKDKRVRAGGVAERVEYAENDCVFKTDDAEKITARFIRPERGGRIVAIYRRRRFDRLHPDRLVIRGDHRAAREDGEKAKRRFERVEKNAVVYRLGQPCRYAKRLRFVLSV